MKINSERVKKLRAAKPWSQEELSDASGLSLRTIQRIESSGNASIDSVRALAAVFEVDPNELILTKNDKQVTPLEAIKTCFIQFADFSGKATRFEYWWFFLFVLLTTAVATIIHDRAYQIVAVIMLLPFIAVRSRRLNDIGRSGWWQLLFLVPFGQIVVFYFLAEESNTNLTQSSTESFEAA